MNRRDALKSLLATPGIGAVSVAELRPSDIIVIECDYNPSDEQIDNIKRCCELTFPGHKHVIVEKGMRLSIQRPVG